MNTLTSSTPALALLQSSDTSPGTLELITPMLLSMLVSLVILLVVYFILRRGLTGITRYMERSEKHRDRVERSLEQILARLQSQERER